MRKLYFLLIILTGIGTTSAYAQRGCSASFTHAVSSTNSLTVTFTESSTASPGSFILDYEWTFGDGDSSFVQNPSHTYSSAGTYTACLTIRDSVNCVNTRCVTYTLTAPIICDVDFTYTTDTSNNVYFSSYNNLQNVTYAWNFGDGDTSSAANPTHQYAASGSYGVTLSVTDGIDSCFYYDTVYVNFCKALFTAIIDSNGRVTFNNNSLYNPTTTGFTWNFGDSTFAYTTNATHTYRTSGTYYVRLSLNDSLGACTSFFDDTLVINLNSTNNSCIASFDHRKDTSVARGIIIENSSSNESTHTYSWDFGDSTILTGRNPSHNYQNFGTYLVCLTITDTVLNCTSTFCDSIGMDSSGNLKSSGAFGVIVQEAILVGLNEAETDESFNSFKFFPNPAKNQLSIEIGELRNSTQIELLDLSGRVIISDNLIANEQFNWNIEALSNGIYFIRLNDGINQKTEKLIIAN